jgi:hypothetical protein
VLCYVGDNAVNRAGGNIIFVREPAGDRRRRAYDKAVPTNPNVGNITTRGSTRGVRHGTHEFLIPFLRRTPAYRLLGQLRRRDTARVDGKDHHIVNSGGLQRRKCNTPPPDTHNSSGHRIAYGRAWRPPPH